MHSNLEGGMQVLGLEIKEVRVVAREDIRKTERQHLHTSRSTRTQVSLALFGAHFSCPMIPCNCTRPSVLGFRSRTLSINWQTQKSGYRRWSLPVKGRPTLLKMK